MGKGSFQQKTYRTNQGFFSLKDYDPNYGGVFWFVIEPLHGWEDKRFFYVKQLPNGEYEITGEGYVITKSERLTKHLAALRKELAGVIIYYYFIDDDGKVVREESSPAILNRRQNDV